MAWRPLPPPGAARARWLDHLGLDSSSDDDDVGTVSKSSRYNATPRYLSQNPSLQPGVSPHPIGLPSQEIEEVNRDDSIDTNIAAEYTEIIDRQYSMRRSLSGSGPPSPGMFARQSSPLPPQGPRRQRPEPNKTIAASLSAETGRRAIIDLGHSNNHSLRSPLIEGGDVQCGSPIENVLRGYSKVMRSAAPRTSSQTVYHIIWRCWRDFCVASAATRATTAALVIAAKNRRKKFLSFKHMRSAAVAGRRRRMLLLDVISWRRKKYLLPPWYCWVRYAARRALKGWKRQQHLRLVLLARSSIIYRTVFRTWIGHASKQAQQLELMVRRQQLRKLRWAMGVWQGAMTEQASWRDSMLTAALTIGSTRRMKHERVLQTRCLMNWRLFAAATSTRRCRHIELLHMRERQRRLTRCMRCWQQATAMLVAARKTAEQDAVDEAAARRAAAEIEATERLSMALARWTQASDEATLNRRDQTRRRSSGAMSASRKRGHSSRIRKRQQTVTSPKQLWQRRSRWAVEADILISSDSSDFEAAASVESSTSSTSSRDSNQSQARNVSHHQEQRSNTMGSPASNVMMPTLSPPDHLDMSECAACRCYNLGVSRADDRCTCRNRTWDKDIADAKTSIQTGGGIFKSSSGKVGTDHPSMLLADEISVIVRQLSSLHGTYESVHDGKVGNNAQEELADSWYY
eukprot:SAG31_NODE_1899_length_6960_cov_18.360880_2_plen_687_part_00